MERRVPDGPRHEGEQAVQRRAEEGGEGWGSPMFDAGIPPAFAAFLHAQPVVFIGSADRAGLMWSSMLVGEAGFAEVTGPRTVVLHALPCRDDALAGAFEEPVDVGLVAVDFARRRRIRINGRAVRTGDSLTMQTSQVLGNCPKYIQRRVPSLAEPVTGASAAGDRGPALDDLDRQWIREADTFFIASRAAQHGADCSHRGGMPGFVRVSGDDEICWPDYVGNSFYMTLGNMTLDARCGLLFVDWESGDTLQLSGVGRVDWDPASAAGIPGALRMVRFSVARAVRVRSDTRVRWRSLS
jgi:predicted pyridoxine 5'-phosphate oxidase superfamily flavin-nucleotide-binding protein